jgi:hypothetical protein
MGVPRGKTEGVRNSDHGQSANFRPICTYPGECKMSTFDNPNASIGGKSGQSDEENFSMYGHQEGRYYSDLKESEEI